MVEHHALGQQFAEGFAHLGQPQVAHHLGPEARIEQVQDGVLDTADVLIHRHPVIGARIHHGLAVVARVTEEIPGRIHEGIHGIGLALRRAAALGTLTLRNAAQLVQRIAGAVRHQILGQHHRKLLVGHRHIAAAAGT